MVDLQFLITAVDFVWMKRVPRSLGDVGRMGAVLPPWGHGEGRSLALWDVWRMHGGSPWGRFFFHHEKE